MTVHNHSPWRPMCPERTLADGERRGACLADCGVGFEHDPHAYRTERGKVKACDGSVTKREAGA